MQRAVDVNRAALREIAGECPLMFDVLRQAAAQ
jgi:hypothetical protein